MTTNDDKANIPTSMPPKEEEEHEGVKILQKAPHQGVKIHSKVDGSASDPETTVETGVPDKRDPETGRRY